MFLIKKRLLNTEKIGESFCMYYIKKHARFFSNTIFCFDKKMWLTSIFVVDIMQVVETHRRVT